MTDTYLRGAVLALWYERVRIPAEVAERVGIPEGDVLAMQVGLGLQGEGALPVPDRIKLYRTRGYSWANIAQACKLPTVEVHRLSQELGLEWGEADASRDPEDQTPTMFACRRCGFRSKASKGHVNCKRPTLPSLAGVLPPGDPIPVGRWRH